MRNNLQTFPFLLFLLMITGPGLLESQAADPKLLPTEKIKGDTVWVMPGLTEAFTKIKTIKLTVWFDKQLLGDGKAYPRRAQEFAAWKRRELREAAMAALKALNEESFGRAAPALDKLAANGRLSDLTRHWIVNGFTCRAGREEFEALKAVPGVRMIFADPYGQQQGRAQRQAFWAPPAKDLAFNPAKSQLPWYTRGLLADKVWKEFKITGKGTVNAVMDNGFFPFPNVVCNLYRNPKEKPGNNKDDDGNGLVDDCHGYNFSLNSPNVWLSMQQRATPQLLHGTNCASYICGRALEGNTLTFGIAPEARWTPIIASGSLEAAVEWSVEQKVDTCSMSFSLPGQGEFRSHWRKVMEHGSLCGIYFVSGAGNFADQSKRNFAPVPVQMRTPEDIPDVVFAAAGVGRDLKRPAFSSQGPVVWKTEHYKDGTVQKPAVAAFNFQLPRMNRNGAMAPAPQWLANGNSFAGPMYCGTISLMLEADPDLLPWDLKEIITDTATDIGTKGLDYQSGHGLINCYRAVKEVLRRKALREGRDPRPFEGRVPGDELDITKTREMLAEPVFQ